LEAVLKNNTPFKEFCVGARRDEGSGDSSGGMKFVEKLRRPRRRWAAAEMRPQKYEGAVIFGSMLNTKARCEAAERVCVKAKTEKKARRRHVSALLAMTL
jgi:hypothetical protein